MTIIFAFCPLPELCRATSFSGASDFVRQLGPSLVTTSLHNRKSGFVRRRRYEVQARFYTGTLPVHFCEPGRRARVVEFPGCWPKSVIQPRYERRRNGFPELYLHRQPDGWLKPLWLRRSSSNRPEFWFGCLPASPPRDIDSQYRKPVHPYRCGGNPRTAEHVWPARRYHFARAPCMAERRVANHHEFSLQLGDPCLPAHDRYHLSF